MNKTLSFVLMLFFFSLSICSAADISSSLPNDKWMEIESTNPIILKTYVVKPDRTNISINIMFESAGDTKNLKMDTILDNFKTAFVNSNAIFSSGTFNTENNVILGSNTWSLLTFRLQLEALYLFVDTYVIISSDKVFFVSFIAASEEEYKEFVSDVKSCVTKIVIK